MKNNINFNVSTKHGDGILEQIYTTELGYIMGRVYYPKKGIRVNYILSNIWELTNKVDMEIKPNTGEKVQIEEVEISDFS